MLFEIGENTMIEMKHSRYIVLRNRLLGNKYLRVCVLEMDYGAKLQTFPIFNMKYLHIFIFRLLGYVFLTSIVKKNYYLSLDRNKKFNNYIETSEHFYYMDEIPEVLDDVE